MRNTLFGSRGLAVDGSGKKPVQVHGLLTGLVCSIFCRVDKLPSFTPLPSHVFQVAFHCQNRFFISVNFPVLPTINTLNNKNNNLNKLILLSGGCV